MVDAVHQTLNALHNKDGLPFGSIAVAGFSQGAALTAETVLRFPHSIAGYVVLCGWLTPAARSSLMSSRNQRTPVLLGHSCTDEEVDFKCAELAQQRLLDAGTPVKHYTISNMGHIPAAFQMLPEAITFLAEAFANTPRAGESVP